MMPEVLLRDSMTAPEVKILFLESFVLDSQVQSPKHDLLSLTVQKHILMQKQATIILLFVMMLVAFSSVCFANLTEFRMVRYAANDFTCVYCDFSHYCFDE